ncbi:MAG: hypothetical protein JJE39_16715, partial [Vicinamibacteria bacterium]|nr:hypothetical protein [Vicinamibacteria bacterium]
REILAGSVALPTLLHAASTRVLARDYASRHEALDDLDRLASVCARRLRALRRSRADAETLATRYLSTLRKHAVTRDRVRRRLALPRDLDPGSEAGLVDGDLPGLRQALDDLMMAYGESLPVYGDSKVVSLLAIDMVEVSKLRTVIDLWVEAEAE